MNLHQLYEIKTKGLEFIGTIPDEHINDRNHYRYMAQTAGISHVKKCAVIIFENYNYIGYKHTYDPATNSTYYNNKDKHICDTYFR